MSRSDSKDGGAHDDEAGAAPAPGDASAEAKLAEAANAAAPNGAPESTSSELADSAWPPREAAPPSEAAPASQAAPTVAAAPPDAAAPPSEIAALSEADRAALPSEEMGFSNSTLHWLADGDASRPTTGAFPVTTPSFDPTAPVAGRRRAVLVVGGAALIALVVAGTLYVQAGGRGTAPVAETADPARDLLRRAEAALAQNHVVEALDLARLALVADSRSADAHFIVASCEQARGQVAASRDEYRKYLDLAPLGIHAEAARNALAALPP